MRAPRSSSGSGRFRWRCGFLVVDDLGGWLGFPWLSCDLTNDARGESISAAKALYHDVIVQQSLYKSHFVYRCTNWKPPT
ncbi:uncharacterized protein RSE6_12031 [Rhynchosporium secalis]|uniref:Uncharacterized protein n=1 Tax=Rhynchosporium secalis TaxID=38038 RepID=A0A1E1MPF4_RHYSE|nr:uncharacterized protein RSE6_12031 [Rhynchosporium secalis]